MGEDIEFLRKVVRLLDNPEDTDLMSEVEQACASSAEKEKIYQDFVRLWNQSDDLGLLERISTAGAVDNISDRLGIKLSPPKPIFSRLIPWLAAASILLVFGLWLFHESRNPALITKRTLSGQMDSLILEDESRIYISGNSVLKYPLKFDNNKREVYLETGEAFFDITRDEKHPFVVQLNSSKVTVLGTSFNISSNKETVEVSVKTGKVKFEPGEGGKGFILSKGTGISYNLNEKTYKKIESVSQNDFAWLTRELSFEDAPLKEVLQELEHYYSVRFVSDSFTSDSKFNANFKNSDLDEVLEILKETYPITIEHKDSLVYVRGRNK